jgi:N-acetyl-gamma-glutamyl-phosphate reductase common form
MSEKIQAVILGATGYVGGELLRILATHPDMQLAAAVSESRSGTTIASSFPHLSSAYGNKTFSSHEDWTDAIDEGSKLALFSAAPHGASAAIISDALDAAASKNLSVHVVDSSADFRYASSTEFESVYGVEHGAPALLPTFQCAVPEHAHETTLPHVGHPGCFATAVLLASVPLLSATITNEELFVTGVTGSTGSGKSPQAGTHHPERHSNYYAYKPLQHRHTPEIINLANAASGRSAAIHFVPHSGPYARGIHVTVQARTTRNVSQKELLGIFREAYAAAPFVEVLDGMPKLKNVVASNHCQIGVASSGDTVVVVCAIDNLVKGAAGGAVQWMNRLWALPETSGLLALAPAWT